MDWVTFNAILDRAVPGILIALGIMGPVALVCRCLLPLTSEPPQ